VRSVRTTELDKEIKRGGEGTIRLLRGEPERLAKVLHQPRSERLQKIEAMIVDPRTQLRELCAWPDGPVIDERGRCLGFTMRRAPGVEWFLLAGIGSRSQLPWTIDYRFLVGCSANLARAIATLHAQGIVVGDINESLPLVAQDGKVTLIDCDSFQFEAGGQLFTCDVAKPEYLPPELQGSASVRSIRRQKQHDLFGLAVLIFQMLMLDRHPFSGVPVSGDLPVIEECIRRKMYAYARPTGARGLRPPPRTLPLEALGAECMALFDAAFAGGERPSASNWVAVLDRLMGSLRRCSLDPAHWSRLTQCPLCDVEGESQREIFARALRVGEEIAFIAAAEIDRLWRAVESVAPPSEPAALPASWVGRMRSPRETWRKIAPWVQGISVLAAAVILYAQSAAGILIFVGLIAAVIAANLGREKRAAASRLFKEAVRRRDDLVGQWKRAASGEPFAQVRSHLTTARERLRSLPEAYRVAFRAAEKSRRDDQMQEYLARQRLDRASIKGIGRGRVAALRSFGIETAADVTRQAILAVPGFGDVLIKSLLTFRATVERGFVFDPTQPVNPRKISEINHDFRSKQGILVSTLAAGPASLAEAARQCAADCEQLKLEIQRAIAAAQEAR
jgi:DNA-binding helix-hairpin-helix protein with protein kinase domain